MHDYLIEIVFKSVNIDQIGNLLKNLTACGTKITNYNLTCSSLKIDWSKSEAISYVFLENKNFGLFLNINELIIGDICLLNCGLCVYKNESSINFELNTQLSDIKNYGTDLLNFALMKAAKSIATEYHIAEYFSGIEPAEDMKTRLFTNDQIGPFLVSKIE